MIKFAKKAEKLRKKIQKLNKNIAQSYSELRKLKTFCAARGHVVEKISFPLDDPIVETAECNICGERLGWWCPESPDHLCHYSESEDWCDYCDTPKERK